MSRRRPEPHRCDPDDPLLDAERREPVVSQGALRRAVDLG
jgi:hypothetical protein